MGELSPPGHWNYINKNFLVTAKLVNLRAGFRQLFKQ